MPKACRKEWQVNLCSHPSSASCRAIHCITLNVQHGLFLSYELHDVYRALDVLGTECDLIQTEVYKNSHFLGKRNDKILYYDCSNYYFEIEQEDGNKKYGKSKEHRPNPIIQMGLFMDGDGIPLAFSLFPGNANEQTSLKPLEKKGINYYSSQQRQKSL